MRCRFLLPLIVAALPFTAAAQQSAPAPGAEKAPPAAQVPAADQPSREQLFKLFEVMRIRAQVDSMLQMMPKAIEQQLKNQEQSMAENLPEGAKASAEQKAILDRITEKYMRQAFSLYPVDEMLEDMVPFYQRHLTRADVAGVIAFYESDPGKHILDTQPAMVQEMMPTVLKKMEARSRKLTDRFMQEMTDALKATPPPAKPGKA